MEGDAMNIGAIGTTFLPMRQGTAAATPDDGASFANALDGISPPIPGSVTVQPSDANRSDMPDIGGPSSPGPSGFGGSTGPESRRHVVIA
jgi:hypothetical protein